MFWSRRGRFSCAAVHSKEITFEHMLTPHQVVAVIRAALLFWQEEIAIHEPGVGYSYWQDAPYDPLSPDEVAELRRHLRFVKYVQVDPESGSPTISNLLSAADLAATAIPPREVAIVILPLE
jgi:hypothetical protein